MESTLFGLELNLNCKGMYEHIDHGFIRSRIDKCLIVQPTSENDYFDILITLSEYSFGAFMETEDFNNMFHYDYCNDVDIDFIHSKMSNAIIRSPNYEQYCSNHMDGPSVVCMNCLERYRTVTRNLIDIMRTFRKDLCSIYFIDILYDLIRFENRDTYALITFIVNAFADGSSFKSFANTFGKKKIIKLLKRLNRPFRRCDYKLILKKYMPLVYRVYCYCANGNTDCLDKVYDFMLYHGLSMFKNVPSEHIVVGYKIDNDYRIDIIKTDSVINLYPDLKPKIASHGLLEGINLGFYEARSEAYREVLKIDLKQASKLKKVFCKLSFSGRSVFSDKLIHSNDCIIIGFLKSSINTFQNFRLDIHIPSLLTNSQEHDKLRFVNHDKWQFEDNLYDQCYSTDSFF